MDQLLSDSPWGVKAVVYGLTILVLFFAMYAIPFTWLQRFGKWPGCSANWISIWRVPITWAGIAIYLSYRNYWGFTLTVVGLLLDFMDGRVAAALKLLNDPRYPGVTDTGKVLDPACDKLCIVPFFILVAHEGLFSVWACVVMAGFELFGTLIRPPFIKLRWRWLRPLKRRIRRSDATGVGKTKMVAQCVTLLITVPYILGWWDRGPDWMSWVVWAIVAMTAASVASRLRLHKAVDEQVDSVTGAFNHVNGIFGFLKRGNGIK
jgi:phosphatidylglycerophosphate synthase